MKKILLASMALFLQTNFNAQCGSPVSGGNGSSMLFGMSRGCLNPVVADKVLNTVAFVHRTNTLTTGNFGNIVYDISTNAGGTWSTNVAILNPAMPALARFPNLTLYNPPSNTTPANAYLGYMSATINTLSVIYNGVVTGVRQISGSGNTENYNQPIANTSFIAGSIVKGAPGVFWALDALYNGSYVTGFSVYKGVWSNSTNDIVWANNFSVTPSFNTGLTTTGAVPADYNIAFDPTGTKGYISFLGHLSTGPGAYAYYPVVYTTTNSGTSWSGPTVIDITQFGCFTSNVGTGNVPSTNFEHDLTVDVNGNPHLITVLLNGNNAYAVYYGLWHHVFDITLKNGLWAAYDLGAVNAGRGTYGTAPNTVSQDIFPRIARSADGNNIFYTWTDNSSYSAGAPNVSPNLFSKAYNVVTDMWTNTKDFSSCNTSANGKMIFPHLAPEVLEPSSGQFKLAPVYGEFSTSANDPMLTVNYKFLDNATYASTEFSVASTAAVVNISPGPNVLLCPGSTITIGTGTSTGQFLWSTTSTLSSISISSGTTTTYSVVAQQNCLVGTASITVSNLTFTGNVNSPSICPGASATFTAAGNALGYTWLPTGFTGTTITLNPTGNVTLSAMGSGSCTTQQVLNITIMPQPTLSISASISICAGTAITATVSGAQNYTWSTGTTGPNLSETPLTNTVYTVFGIAANTCTNTQTMSVTVKPTPTVNVNVSQPAVCAGQTVGLLGGGATSYSWDAVSSPANITVTPSITTVYTLTGANANGCQNSKTISVTVNALPSITITPAKAFFCKGEKIKLTASGANTYTWASPGSLTFSVNVNPSVTTTYSVDGATIEGCLNSKTFTLTVNPCTGIAGQGVSDDAVLIYPNPNNGSFTIKAEGDVSLQLLNELGQVIKIITLDSGNTHEISVQELSAGIYFIVGQYDGRSLKQKIVITR